MRTTKLIVVAFLVFALCLTATPVFARWNLDRYIEEIESYIPVAEKQAAILIRMLNSDEHRQKINDDIAKYSGDRPRGLTNKDDSYVYKVLKQLEYPIEKSEVNLYPLFPRCFSSVGGGDFDRRQYSRYTSFLEPQFLLAIALGITGTEKGNDIYLNADLLKNPENASKLVQLLNNVLNIHRPLHLAAQNLTSNVSTYSARDYIYGRSLNQGFDGRHQNYTFWFLLPEKTPYVSYKDQKNSVLGKMDLVNYDINYLNFLKKMFQFFDEINYKALVHKQGDTVSFRELVHFIDDIIDKKSDVTDFSDLLGDTAPSTESPSQSQDLDLNIDDLKLPEF